jgi:hypothetical protein
VRRIDTSERVLTVLTIVAGVIVLIVVLLLTGCGKKPVQVKVPENPPPKFHVTLRGAKGGQCHVVDVLKDAKDPTGQIWVCKEGLQ